MSSYASKIKLRDHLSDQIEQRARVILEAVRWFPIRQQILWESKKLQGYQFGYKAAELVGDDVRLHTVGSFRGCREAATLDVPLDLFEGRITLDDWLNQLKLQNEEREREEAARLRADARAAEEAAEGARRALYERLKEEYEGEDAGSVRG